MARVLISLPDEFLQEIDRFAAAEQRSRSELIREALRLYMASKPAAQRPTAISTDAQKALDEIQKIRRDVQPSAGPTSEAWLQSQRDRHG